MSVEKVQKRLAVQERQAWEAALATEAGRLLVWSILAECGVFRSSFVRDPSETAFAEGKRAVGLSIMNTRILAHDPDLFAAMMNENAARHDEIERAIQAEQDDAHG